MIRHPTNDELFEMVCEALRKAPALPYALGQELRWWALSTSRIVWGADHYAGHCCPLRAVGVERQHGWWGAWLVHDGWRFEDAYDRAMDRFVGLRGPGLISTSDDPKPGAAA